MLLDEFPVLNSAPFTLPITSGLSNTALGALALAVGVGLISAGYAPLIRQLLGYDELFSFLTVLLLCSAGLMAGFSGMVLLARGEAARLIDDDQRAQNERRVAAMCHWGSLLIWLGVPLGNFFVPFLLWKRGRHRSGFIDRHGRRSINFQISITLYLLLSVMMIYAIAGLIAILMVALLHILASAINGWRAWRGRECDYPFNIRIIVSSAPS